jgi:hypothetical protein
MSRRAPFLNVERRSSETRSPAAEAKRAMRQALMNDARAKVRADLTALFKGCSGEYREFMIEELLFQGFDLAAEHRDGAFACARAGVHANRIGGQTIVTGRKLAAAQALFSAEGVE